MTSARLLSIVLMLGPLMAFAQEKPQPSNQPPQAATADSLASAAQENQLKAQAEAARQFLASQHFDPNSGDQPWIKISPDGKILAWGIEKTGVEKTCYAIRSYVVERDEKDSDSTHLVRTSTCVPANQYGIKTTEMRSSPTTSK
jgi:hypothetical protein